MMSIMENSKVCSKCRESKDRSLFHASARYADGLASYCKVCAAAATRASRVKNLDRHLSKSRAAQREFIEWIKPFKAEPCTDCGETYPYYVMQFDHVPGRGEKLFNVTSSYTRPRWKVLEEMAKCDLVCANCHAERTHGRRDRAL